MWTDRPLVEIFGKIPISFKGTKLGMHTSKVNFVKFWVRTRLASSASIARPAPNSPKASHPAPKSLTSVCASLPDLCVSVRLARIASSKSLSSLPDWARVAMDAGDG